MSGVQASLEFDTSEAESAIDALDARLEAVTASFSASLTDAIESALGAPIEVTADAAGIQSDVEAALADTSGSVEVAADVTAAEAEIASLDPDAVEVPVTADTAQAEEAIAGLTTDTAGAADAFGGASEAAGSFAGALAGAGGAARILTGVGLGAFILSSTQAFAESEGVFSIVGQVIANVGDEIGVTAAEVEALAGRVQSYSGISDEAVGSAAALVAQLGSVRNAAGEGNNVFDRTIMLSADLSRVFGTDITGAARQLGRALADPERGISRLERSIGPLDQAVKDNIATLTAQGDTLGAQRVLLDALEERVGGVAAAYGDSLPGQLDKARESFDNFQEIVGQVAAEGLPLVTAGLEILAAGLTVAGPFVGAFARGLEAVGDALALIPTPIALVAGAYIALTVAARGALTAMLLLSAANPVTLALIGAAAAVTALGAALGLLDAQSEPLRSLSGEALGTREALEAATQGAQTLAQTLAESGQAAFVEQVLGEIVRISPQVVSALNESGTSVADLVAAIQGGQVVAGEGGFLESIVAQAGLTGDAAETAEGQLAELAYQISISANAADELTSAEEANAGALGGTAEAAAEAERALQSLVNQSVGNLPTLADAIANVNDNADGLGEFVLATDPTQVTDNLRQMVDAFIDFTANIETIRDISPVVARALAPLGPEIAGQFTAALANLPPRATRELAGVLRAADRAGLDLTEVLTSGAASGVDGAVGALNAGGGRVAGAARGAGRGAGGGFREGARETAATGGTEAMAAAGAAITAAAPTGPARTAGVLTANAFGQSLERMSLLARVQTTLVGGAILAAAPTATARAAGVTVGQALGQGIQAGLASTVSAISAEAARAVNDAETAARSAADANSPSRLFARLGKDIGDGIAVGIAGTQRTVREAAAGVVRDAGVGLAAAGTVRAGAGAGAGGVTVLIEQTIDARGSDPAATGAAVADATVGVLRRQLRADVALAQR